MAKLSNDELIEAFKEMSLIELSEFVKQFEDVFDVTAAAPVAMPRPRRRRTSSTSSSSPPAPRRSPSSRRCAASPPSV
jgi:large subunit ribosomal protein L7/L12